MVPAGGPPAVPGAGAMFPSSTLRAIRSPMSAEATTETVPRTGPTQRPETPRRRAPLATYRLQLHAGFGFGAAAAVVPYLDQLGITECYTSPHLKARPGSTHGYDIVDHGRLNPELGGAADYEAFTDALRARSMGHFVDFVPNHIGVDAAANPWWRDVLENGRGSPYARFFDIDWNPVKAELTDKVLLPILGDRYGAVLERGELRLAFTDGLFTVHYTDHDLPIAPGQFPQILSHELGALRAALGDEDPDLIEYLSIITELRNLPP